MSNIVKIEAKFDIDNIREQIEASKDIKGDEAYFEQLVEIQRVKNQLGDIADLIKSIESEAKGLINNKAKALYGDNWQVIKGERFKILRSKTGDVYLINGEPNSKFVKVKKSIDTKIVDSYVTEKGKLPKGIEINDQRGESIRITIDEDN